MATDMDVKAVEEVAWNTYEHLVSAAKDSPESFLGALAAAAAFWRTMVEGQPTEMREAMELLAAKMTALVSTEGDA